MHFGHPENHIFVHTYMYIYIYIYIFLHMHIHVYVYIQIHINVYMYTHGGKMHEKWVLNENGLNRLFDVHDLIMVVK